MGAGGGRRRRGGGLLPCRRSTRGYTLPPAEPAASLLLLLRPCWRGATKEARGVGTGTGGQRKRSRDCVGLLIFYCFFHRLFAGSRLCFSLLGICCVFLILSSAVRWSYSLYRCADTTGRLYAQRPGRFAVSLPPFVYMYIGYDSHASHRSLSCIRG